MYDCEVEETPNCGTHLSHLCSSLGSGDWKQSQSVNTLKPGMEVLFRSNAARMKTNSDRNHDQTHHMSNLAISYITKWDPFLLYVLTKQGTQELSLPLGA